MENKIIFSKMIVILMAMGLCLGMITCVNGQTPDDLFDNPPEGGSGTEMPVETTPEDVSVTTPEVDFTPPRVELGTLGATEAEGARGDEPEVEEETTNNGRSEDVEDYGERSGGYWSRLMDSLGMGGGTQSTGPTPGVEGPGGEEGVVDPYANLPTGTPKTLCPEEVPDFDSDLFSGSIAEDATDENKTKFIDQWCAFSKLDAKGKEAAWGKMDKKQLQEALGNQYHVSISGLDSEGTTWQDNNLVLSNGNKINMDFEKYYGDDNSKDGFSFGGKEGFEYPRKSIRKIDIAADGSINVVMGDVDRSTIKLAGENIEFNPETMTINSGGKDFKWNGQGNVDFDSAAGKVKLDFGPGVDSSDVTNFPIMQLASGEEISPFQQEVSGMELPEGVTQPEDGFSVFEEGGKQYTVDSKGVVREVMSSEIEIDSTSGGVKSLQNAYLNNPEFKGDLFASGKYNIGKGGAEGESYFDLSGGVLTVKSEGGDTLHYEQGSDLTKLDVSGSGTTFIRNGDNFMKFQNNKMSGRLLPAELQEHDGKYAYTIDEIVDPENPENPYKIVKGEDGNVVLQDSSGKAADINQLGVIVAPPVVEETPGVETPGTETPGQINPNDLKLAQDKMKNNGPGSFSLSSDGHHPMGGHVTSDTITIEGLDGLEKDLSYEEFRSKVGNDLPVTFTLNVKSAWVKGEAVAQSLGASGMDPGMSNLIITEFESTYQSGAFAPGNNGKSLTITIAGGQITNANWAGKDLTAQAAQYGPKGVTFLQQVISTPPKQSRDSQIYYSGSKTPINTPAGNLYYAQYQQLHAS
jgi:hypothetical protein